MPAGLTLNNIQNVTLNTAGTAGQANILQGGLGTVAGNTFNTSNFASVTSTVVNSQGSGYMGGITGAGLLTSGEDPMDYMYGDAVQASNNSSITVNHANVRGSVLTLGGNNVTVNTNGDGGVAVAAYAEGSSQVLPTGNVIVNANGYLEGAADVDVVGGKDVTVTIARATASGDINIGNTGGHFAAGEATAILNPTGNITVVDNSTAAFNNLYGDVVWMPPVIDYEVDPPVVIHDGYWLDVPEFPNDIIIHGGVNVTVTAKGDKIVVGEADYNDEYMGAKSDVPSGNVLISNVQPTTHNDLTGKGNSTYQGGDVSVFGGVNVDITTNTGGAVNVGWNNGDNTTALATGTIKVDNRASSLNGGYQIGEHYNDMENNILGGTDVTVKAAGSGVYIGVYGSSPDSVAVSGLPTLAANPTGFVDVRESVASDEEIVIDGGNGIYVDARSQTVAIGTYTGVSGNVEVHQRGAYTGTTTVFNPSSTPYTLAPGGEIAGVSTTGVDSTVYVDGGANVSVNTTGGNVLVGTDGDDNASAPLGLEGDGLVHVPTGAVYITNTFSGAGNANKAGAQVKGGSTVNVTFANSTNGAILVGAAPALNSTGAAGTSLANAALSPTGNVTINNSVTNGTTTTYGTSRVNVYTNGAQQVSITGAEGTANSIAGAVVVADINAFGMTGGVNAGKAVGTSVLSNVILDGVKGYALVDSNAISALTIADSFSTTDVSIGGAVMTAAGYTAVPAHALALTLSNSVAGTTLHDATASSLTIGTTGTKANTIALDVKTATSLTFNNAASLTLSTKNGADVVVQDFSALKTVTANNSGALNLGDLSGVTTLTSVNGAAATGNITVELNGDKATFVGGLGNDVVTVDTAGFNGQASRIVGGGGIDRVIVTNTQANYDPLIGGTGLLINDFTGFEQLGLKGASITGTYNVAGFTDVAVYSGITSAITVDQLSAGSTLSLLATDASKITVKQAATGPLTVNISGTVDSTGTPTNTTITNLELSKSTGNKSPDVLTINSIGGSGVKNYVNTLTVTGGSATTTLNVTGDSKLVLTDSAKGKIDTANVTSSGATDLSGVKWASGGATVTGGSGLLTVNLDYSAASKVSDLLKNNDLLTSGSGGVFANLGAGSSRASTGGETVNLIASSSVRDTLVALTNPSGDSTNGTSAQVIGFANGVTGDVLAFSNSALSGASALPSTVAPVVISNVAAASAISGTKSATYTVSNGVITVASAGTSTIAERLADAIKIVDGNLAGASGGANGLGMIQLAGSTYVIRAATATEDAQASVIELTGTTGVTGFTASYDSHGVGQIQLGAGNSIAIATDLVQTTFANVSHASALSTTVNNTIDDTGWAGDVFSGTKATVTTTYNNLANAAVIQTATGANDGGKVVVNQIGTGTGLGIYATGATVLDSLTYGGNLLIDNTLGDVQIKSLVSTTSTQVQITSAAGTKTVAIDAITDPALTLIDASNSLGGRVTLGTENIATYLSQTGLTVKGGAGGLTVWASGNGDVFTTLEVTSLSTNDNVITAAGSNNTFNLAGDDTVSAGGSNNIFNVLKDGETDTVTIQGPKTGDLSSNTGIGANAVITIGDVGDVVTVNLQGTVTGGTSASYSYTTITGASNTAVSGADKLIFNNATNESVIGQVNVAEATTLAQALDLAARVASASAADGSLKVDANTGIINWFQFGGNTYIVETVNASKTTAVAQTGIDANDVVVKLTGLVDLTDAQFAAHTLTL